MRRFSRVLGAVTFTVALACPAAAGGEEGHAPHWHEQPHHISLIVGGTSTAETTAFTLGLDYEYRVHELLGLGTVVEYAGQDLDALTMLAVADIHLWRGLAAQTGPGLELIDDDDFFVYRVGLLYEFEIGEYTLSPQVHMDVSDEEWATIFGIAAGFPF